MQTKLDTMIILENASVFACITFYKCFVIPMQNLLQKWYRILENETNRETTILRTVEQRNRKRDEENKHQKQETLVREPKINHFYVVKKCNKMRNNNMKISGAKKP